MSPGAFESTLVVVMIAGFVLVEFLSTGSTKRKQEFGGAILTLASIRKDRVVELARREHSDFEEPLVWLVSGCQLFKVFNNDFRVSNGKTGVFADEGI